MFETVSNPTAAAASIGKPAGDTSWKATAFINLYLPTKDGGRRKMGYIALKDSKALDREIITYLSEETEERTKELLSKMELDFNLADTGNEPVLALG